MGWVEEGNLQSNPGNKTIDPKQDKTTPYSNPAPANPLDYLHVVQPGDNLWNIAQGQVPPGNVVPELGNIEQDNLQILSPYGSGSYDKIQIGDLIDLPDAQSPLPAGTLPGTLAKDVPLGPNGAVMSADGAFLLEMRTDGNLVLYQLAIPGRRSAADGVIWTTDTGGQGYTHATWNGSSLVLFQGGITSTKGTSVSIDGSVLQNQAKFGETPVFSISQSGLALIPLPLELTQMETVYSSPPQPRGLPFN
jgi:hypothetical protein